MRPSGDPRVHGYTLVGEPPPRRYPFFRATPWGDTPLGGSHVALAFTIWKRSSRPRESIHQGPSTKSSEKENASEERKVKIKGSPPLGPNKTDYLPTCFIHVEIYSHVKQNLVYFYKYFVDSDDIKLIVNKRGAPEMPHPSPYQFHIKKVNKKCMTTCKEYDRIYRTRGQIVGFIALTPLPGVFPPGVPPGGTP